MTVTADISGPAAPETLRRDQQERRERIVRAALRALAHGDYERVKVTDVARDSGVALGTLYRYFTSKEHLFATAFLAWHEGLKRKLERSGPPEGTERERVRQVLHHTVRAFQLQPQFYRVLMVLETTSDPYVLDVYRSLDKGFTEILHFALGESPRSNENRNAIFATLSAVLNEGLRSWIMGRRTIESVYQHIDDTIRLIYHFCPETSRA